MIWEDCAIDWLSRLAVKIRPLVVFRIRSVSNCATIGIGPDFAMTGMEMNRNRRLTLPDRFDRANPGSPHQPSLRITEAPLTGLVVLIRPDGRIPTVPQVLATVTVMALAVATAATLAGLMGTV